MSVSLAQELTLTLLDAAWIDSIEAIERVSLPTPWSRELIASEFAKNYSYVVGAIYGDVLLGYAINNLIIDELHLLTLAVHPDYRRLGIGQMLLDDSLRIGIERKARSAFLEVRKSNVPAQHLYEQAGFCFLGIRRGYYADNGEDALILKRLLPAN